MALSDIKSLGPKRLEQLQAQGIQSEKDLLYYLPTSYVDSSVCTPIAALELGQPACLELRLTTKPGIQYVKGLSIVRAQAEDDSGAIRLIWFNQPWMRQLEKGETLLLRGRPEIFKGALCLQNPRRLEGKGIYPQYSPIGSVGGKVIAGWIAQLIPRIAELIPETLPEALRQQWQLGGIQEALREAHLATGAEPLRRAQRRIAFENLLLWQLALQTLRGEQSRGRPAAPAPGLLDAFWRQAGFAPTRAQQAVMDDILSDLASGSAMRRLVQGDVGSGKTAIALAAAAVMAKAGSQAALMVPTEILARQHFESAQALLQPLGIQSGLLLGSMKAAARREALEAIRTGVWQLVIGTHALLSPGVVYADLQLAITDEQHRFGVKQRQRLSGKAAGDLSPHVLVMSATPIPRTLALMLYGDLDLSVIDELPPGRRPVKTRIVPEDKRADMYAFLRECAARGEQAFLVCPLVEESERIEAKDAQAMFRELAAGPLKGLQLGLTYGSQPEAEKEAVISRFAAGEIAVLVATTVIEVGVNVPSATLMVIENAERFGLSQLHQLRGRVGRGAKESWCFLMGKPNERLRTLCQTNDGFEIARKDLELRGPGDFLGTRQHGRLMPDAYGAGDSLLIDQTRRAAEQLATDPALRVVHARLQALAQQRYRAIFEDIALH